MFDVKERPKMAEKALLIGVYRENREEEEAGNLLEELADLVSTLDIGLVGREMVKVGQYNAKLLMGSGRAHDMVVRVKELAADVVVFDHELSPAQQRNWEELTGVTVIDRHEIILDIFARRAMTKEAQLQVKLARMEYQLPRLTRAWGHLGRQGGTAGPGARGEGEQQLEIDRRLIRASIDQLKKELKHVRRIRSTQRKTRQRIPIPNAAIVGYTNAGKSSLLRAMTGAKVLVADKLFATLDTTTRKIQLPNGHPLLLTDTVGFVRNLPHSLVEAFKATLEEAVLAEFLVHVVDVSHPEAETFHQTTLEVLKELGADEKRILTVFNKVDKLPSGTRLSALRLHHPDALYISTLSGEGLEDLRDAMADMLADRMEQCALLIPHHRTDLTARIHQLGKVQETKYEEDGVRLQALIPVQLRSQLQEFIQEPATPL